MATSSRLLSPRNLTFLLLNRRLLKLVFPPASRSPFSASATARDKRRSDMIYVKVNSKNVKLDPNFYEEHQDVDPQRIRLIKARSGHLHLSCVPMPSEFETALARFLTEEGKDKDLPNIRDRSKELMAKIDRRKAAVSDAELVERARTYKAAEMHKFQVESPDELSNKEKKMINRAVKQKLSSLAGGWRPISYHTVDKCLHYCIGRFSKDYTSVRRVLNEVRMRDPEWSPKSLLDFGSGVGAVFWAARDAWADQVQEYLLIDPSQAMQELSGALIRGGERYGAPIHPSVTYKGLLPGTLEKTYDLTVCAHSLLDFSSPEERFRYVSQMWKLTSTGGYMVLVEVGNNSGFKTIVDCRDFFLAAINEVDKNATRDMLEGEDWPEDSWREAAGVLRNKDITEEEKLKMLEEKFPGVKFPMLAAKGTLVAPCPHSFTCPRAFLDPSHPCNFSQHYEQLNLQAIGGQTNPKHADFSFVIFKKSGEESEVEEPKRWPRVVQPVVKRGNHTHLRLCTANGFLEDVVITKGKAGKRRLDRRLLYKLSRKAEWGDVLPMETRIPEKQAEVEDETDEAENEEEIGQVNAESDGHEGTEKVVGL